MKAAKLEDVTSGRVPGQTAILYRLDPPCCNIEYVVVSAVCNSLVHETMIFAANEDGEVTDWSDLACVRDSTDHARCLKELGYSIAE